MMIPYESNPLYPLGEKIISSVRSTLQVRRDSFVGRTNPRRYPRTAEHRDARIIAIKLLVQNTLYTRQVVATVMCINLSTVKYNLKRWKGEIRRPAFRTKYKNVYNIVKDEIEFKI